MVARGRVSDVLVVGAGPTGLAAALQAQAHGADVRVVERRPDAFRRSRAMMVHSRTLEALRPLGVVEELLDRADRTPSADLHLGRRLVRVRLDRVALRDTPYPHFTLLRQADLEEVLARTLESRGVRVERGVTAVDVGAGEEHATATLVADGHTREATSGFVVGCDGPESTVRHAAGIGWHGKPYGQEVVLADVELDGELAPGVLHAAPGAAGLVFVFALGEGASWRVLATRGCRTDGEFGQPGAPVPSAEVEGILRGAGLDVTVAEQRWSAAVRLQHRLAGTFRHGRLLIAGDAAHAHSPAAAQGMNTGILDAVNLGWKLALADDDGLLVDSYDSERRPVAAQVLALTHAVFFAEASTGPLPRVLRSRMLPAAAPLLPALVAERHLMGAVVWLLSQRWVHHRDSVLSVETVTGGPGPRPGDRLPDGEVISDGRRVRLHELTARPGMHVLLARDAADPGLLATHVQAHRVESWPGGGLAAVRPDGFVGLRSGDGDAGALAAWLGVAGVRVLDRR